MRSSKAMLYAGTAALFAVFALAAAVLANPAYALPILVLAVIVLGFFALNASPPGATSRATAATPARPRRTMTKTSRAPT